MAVRLVDPDGHVTHPLYHRVVISTRNTQVAQVCGYVAEGLATGASFHEVVRSFEEGYLIGAAETAVIDRGRGPRASTAVSG